MNVVSPPVDTSPFERLRPVLSAFVALQDRESVRLRHHAQELTDAWLTIKRRHEASNRDCGALYNPLSLLTISETSHSAILGDWLNPAGHHGQGALFLDSFLAFIEYPSTKGEIWKVTVEKGRVDILVRRQSSPGVVIIENKSNGAVDQQNQLYRYWYHEIRCKHRHDGLEDPVRRAAFKIVYLTPEGMKQPDETSSLRPAEWPASADLPARLPIQPAIFLIPALMQHWTRTVGQSLPRTNHRLKNTLQFYTELWTTS